VWITLAKIRGSPAAAHNRGRITTRSKQALYKSQCPQVVCLVSFFGTPKIAWAYTRSPATTAWAEVCATCAGCFAHRRPGAGGGLLHALVRDAGSDPDGCLSGPAARQHQ